MSEHYDRRHQGARLAHCLDTYVVIRYDIGLKGPRRTETVCKWTVQLIMLSENHQLWSIVEPTKNVFPVLTRFHQATIFPLVLSSDLFMIPSCPLFDA